MLYERIVPPALLDMLEQSYRHGFQVYRPLTTASVLCAFAPQFTREI